MNHTEFKQLNIKVSDELFAKIKGYASLCNIPLGVFVNRILRSEIKKIENGEHQTIKLVDL